MSAVSACPSTTDVYGNEVQEASASGVPVTVTGSGGPRFLVREGVTGFVRDTLGGPREALPGLMRNQAQGGIQTAEGESWP